MKQLIVEINEDTHTKLKVMAASQGTTMTDLVRNKIEELVQ